MGNVEKRHARLGDRIARIEFLLKRPATDKARAASLKDELKERTLEREMLTLRLKRAAV